MRCVSGFVGDEVKDGISTLMRGIILGRTPTHYYIELGGGLELADKEKPMGKVKQREAVWVPVGPRAEKVIVTPFLVPCPRQGKWDSAFERGEKTFFEFADGGDVCKKCGIELEWEQEKGTSMWKVSHPREGMAKEAPCIYEASLLPRLGEPTPLVVEPREEHADCVLFAWQVSSGHGGDSDIVAIQNAEIIVKASRINEYWKMQRRNTEVLAVLHPGAILHARRSGKNTDEVNFFVVTFDGVEVQLELKGSRTLKVT